MKICFISIIGRPNVGKSSLTNAIVGYDVAIVTKTAQTTRDQIIGIYNDEDTQLIFTDTPGIHKPQNKLGEALNKNAYEAAKDVDVVLFLTPADEKIGPGDKMILDKIQNLKHKIAVITKIDTIKSQPEKLLAKMDELQEFQFEHIVSTSKDDFKSIDALIDLIKTYSYEGPLQYDESYVTDKSMRFIAKEIIRESAIEQLRDELPHSIAVEITDFIEDPDDLDEFGNQKILINATIYVKKDSQKGMVIGKNASKIKQIGVNARMKIMRQFNQKTTLNLKVKVAKKWIDNQEALARFGYKN
ncbi:GTPase Era [Mycoplasma corogypsi]|uniref:GTPase Era n=1 Tax=Mycoplasma corogypsi TaxID=2106 RepID=UPI003872ACAF